MIKSLVNSFFLIDNISITNLSKIKNKLRSNVIVCLKKKYKLCLYLNKIIIVCNLNVISVPFLVVEQ